MISCKKSLLSHALLHLSGPVVTVVYFDGSVK